METIPSLCATGTIGVAAIGLAFGRPQHASTTREPKSKRRMTSKASLELKRVFDRTPSTPPSHPSMSAPASTSRSENLFNISRSDDRDGQPPHKIYVSTPQGLPQPGRQQTHHEQTAMTTSGISRGRKSFQFDFKNTENIKPSSAGSKVARSSSRDASPALTSLPGSSTLSQSNSSTAAILPTHNRFGTNLSSRNKLVKRSSSQRLLNGHQDPFSTLRRPATSHQRSATMQRQYLDSEEPRPLESHSSTGRDSLQISNEVADMVTDWRPFFEPSMPRVTKPGSIKRKVPSTNTPFEAPSTLFPDLNDLPTLLLASSVESSASSSGRWTPGQSQQGAYSAPKALRRNEPSPSGEKIQSGEPVADRPRTSFSFSDVFPSPSPLTWKMPRTASLRNRNVLEKRTSNKRVVSEPVPVERYDHYSDPNKTRKLGNHTSIYAMAQPGRNRPRSAGKYAATSYRPSSSPLPPLNRLSSFRLNLPETIPSYPTTPGRKESPPPARTRSSQASPDSPLDSLSRRDRDIAPSGTQSDHASTLLGSEAETSRMLLSEDEDPDGRSSAIYDSMRTAATVNSSASHQVPPVDPIFDGSRPRLLVPQVGSADDLHFGKLSLDAMDHGETSEHRKGLHSNSPLADSALLTSEGNRQGLAKVSAADLPDSKMSNQPAIIDGVRKPESTLSAHTDQRLQKEPGLLYDSSSRSSAATEQSDGHDSGDLVSWRSTPRRRDSPPSGAARPNPFEWSEKPSTEREASGSDQLRPKTVQGRQAQDVRVHRSNSRRGPTPVHLRSQSVPVPTENRSYANSSKLDPRTLGKHGPSEDWDCDFDFDEPPKLPKPAAEGMRLSHSSAMLVPKSILDNQATVHGQFGQVKELTKLVEELKRLQQQGKAHGIMKGQATELWKEAEGIVNLATIDDDDDDHDFLPSASPSTDFDFSDDDSPSKVVSSKDHIIEQAARTPGDATPDRSGLASSQEGPAAVATPPSGALSRQESSAKAKSVLEQIYQHRPKHEHSSFNDRTPQRKLPFDTTSLKDLVTRAGVVTRALKEEIRRHENRNASPVTLANVQPEQRPRTPPDPPFSQVFQKSSSQPPFSKSSRLPQSPKSPRSPKSRPSSVLGGTMPGNDNDINSHMKVMTVV